MSDIQRTILIIENGHSFKDDWMRSLKGWTLLHANDARSALRILSDQPDIPIVISCPLLLSEIFSTPGFPSAARPAIFLLTEDPRMADLFTGRDLGRIHGLLWLNSTPDTLLQSVESGLESYQRGQSMDSSGSEAVPPREPDNGSADGDSFRFPEGKRFSREIQFKEDWVKVVAHDIRSPLTIINNYAHVLLKTDENLSDSARTILERIQDSGRWMIHLIDNILDLSMIEEGRLVLKGEPVRLDSILSSVVKALTPLAEAREVQLEWQDPRDPKTYTLDKMKIEQVLHNLVSNSIKVSGAGKRVALSCRGEGDKITFRVEDSGKGLTQEQIEGIFDKYTRRESAGDSGIGLGLAIAKSIVELHGGTIRVESRPGSGSVFTFTVSSLNS